MSTKRTETCENPECELPVGNLKTKNRKGKTFCSKYCKHQEG
jgi:hypothetical protein